MHRAGGLCCTPLTSVAVNLRSCVKSDHGEHFVSTSDMNHLVGDGSSRILWLFPLGWSRRGLWGVEVKSDRLLQTFFGVQAVPPCPIFCFYLQPFPQCPPVGCCPGWPHPAGGCCPAPGYRPAGIETAALKA